jgi:hypothetical protein
MGGCVSWQRTKYRSLPEFDAGTKLYVLYTQQMWRVMKGDCFSFLENVRDNWDVRFSGRWMGRILPAGVWVRRVTCNLHTLALKLKSQILEIIQYQYNFLSLLKTCIEVRPTFLSSAPWFPKGLCFLDGCHISMLIQSKDLYTIYGFNSVLLKQQLINKF